MKRNEKAITLVALVVTIVVLLILAGITIVYVFGDNGVFGQASQGKVKTELAKIEEQASIIYADKFIAKQAGQIDSISNSDIIEELINNGYQIETRTAGEGSITGISVTPTTVTIDKNETATIKVSLERPEDGNIYYAVVDGKYYKINFINSQLTIEKEATTPEGSAEEPKNIEIETGYDTTIVTNAQINQTEKTIEITSGTKNGNTTITVKYGDKIATCNISVMDAIDKLWAEIAEMAKEIANDDSITNDSTEATVTVNGESKTIKVGELYDVKYNGEIRRVRVLGFKHDDLVNTGVYGGNHSKAGISFEFYDLMTGNTYMQMNTSNTNSGGWGSTKLRTDLNGSGSSIGGLGANLSNKGYIKQVKKKYIATYDSASSVTTCNDYLWLLADSEIVNSGYQSGAYGPAITSEGSQYKYYQGVGEAWNENSTNRVKYNASGGAMHWWLRSPFYNNATAFCRVLSNGSTNSGYEASGSNGVAPGFCI